MGAQTKVVSKLPTDGIIESIKYKIVEINIRPI